MTSPQNYAQLEDAFVRWALAQPAICAAVVVGSRAGGQANAWSDLDLVVFTPNPAAYGAASGWLAELGELWLAVPHHTGYGDPEWRALYAGGLKLDVVLSAAPAGSHLPSLLAESVYRYVFAQGLRALFDKSSPNGLPPPLLGQALGLAPGAANETGGPAEFQALLDAGLLAASQVGRLLVRGELWRARQCLECELKQHLLAMMVWHARLAPGQARAIRDDGQQLEQWVDERVAQALPATCPAYASDSAWSALRATLDLLLELGAETAARAGLPHAAEPGRRIAAWLDRLQKSA